MTQQPQESWEGASGAGREAGRGAGVPRSLGVERADLEVGAVGGVDGRCLGLRPRRRERAGTRGSGAGCRDLLGRFLLFTLGRAGP